MFCLSISLFRFNEANPRPPRCRRLRPSLENISTCISFIIYNRRRKKEGLSCDDIDNSIGFGWEQGGGGGENVSEVMAVKKNTGAL